MKKIHELDSEEIKVYNECIEIIANGYIEYQNYIQYLTQEQSVKEGDKLLDCIAAIVNKLQIHPDQINQDIKDLVMLKTDKIKVH